MISPLPCSPKYTSFTFGAIFSQTVVFAPVISSGSAHGRHYSNTVLSLSSGGQLSLISKIFKVKLKYYNSLELIVKQTVI